MQDKHDGISPRKVEQYQERQGVPAHWGTRFMVFPHPSRPQNCPSFVFLEKGQKNHQKNKDFNPHRAPKIPGKEGKNARKNKEFLAREKNTEFKKKQGKEGQGTELPPFELGPPSRAGTPCPLPLSKEVQERGGGPGRKGGLGSKGQKALKGDILKGDV